MSERSIWADRRGVCSVRSEVSDKEYILSGRKYFVAASCTSQVGVITTPAPVSESEGQPCQSTYR